MAALFFLSNFSCKYILIFCFMVAFTVKIYYNFLSDGHKFGRLYLTYSLYFRVFLSGPNNFKPFLFFFLFMDALEAYGSSHTRGQIRAVAAVCATAKATPNLSHICDLCSSFQQCQLLNPLSHNRNSQSISKSVSLTFKETFLYI